jgi:hypothetical protein
VVFEPFYAYVSEPLRPEFLHDLLWASHDVEVRESIVRSGGRVDENDFWWSAKGRHLVFTEHRPASFQLTFQP